MQPSRVFLCIQWNMRMVWCRVRFKKEKRCKRGSLSRRNKENKPAAPVNLIAIPDTCIKVQARGGGVVASNTGQTISPTNRWNFVGQIGLAYGARCAARLWCAGDFKQQQPSLPYLFKVYTQSSQQPAVDFSSYLSTEVTQRQEREEDKRWRSNERK